MTGPTGPAGPTGPSGILGVFFATQNAGLQTTGSNWVNVPGAFVNFTLGSDSTVELEANGSVTGVAGGGYNGGHCGFRFSVDNQPYGDSSWGDVIVGCPAGNVYGGWWCPWTARRQLPLSKGPHFVYLQQVGWSTGAGCSTDNADYSRARLRIIAHQ